MTQNQRVVIAAMAIAAYGVFRATSPSQASQASQATEQAQILRDEFRTWAVGKTKDEVMARFGRPSSTGEYSDSTYWTYNYITYDPISQKADFMTTVWFNWKYVEKVAF